MKKMVAVMLALVMLMTLVPMSIVPVTAATEYYPTTWEELRDALQSSGEATIIIPKDVVIEYTFDGSYVYVDSTQITIVGKKTIDLRGEIHFYNGLVIGGLFNLDSADDDLTIDGYCGNIVYRLHNKTEDHVWNGDMFYLTDGKLTLGGNCDFTMDYGADSYTSDRNRAVVGGTGGTVIVDKAFLTGHTIFGNGTTYVFRNGAIKGKDSGYNDADLYMLKGTAKFEGCRFDRGISVSPDTEATLVMDNNMICLDRTDKTASAAKKTILFDTPCAFVCVDYAQMDPEMPALSTNCELGKIGLGAPLEISARTPNQNTGLGQMLLKVEYILEVMKDSELIHRDSTTYSNDILSYDLRAADPGSYQLWFYIKVTQYGKEVYSELYRYVVEKSGNIEHVEMHLDTADMNSLTSLDSYAAVGDVVWYEKSKTSDTWTKNPTSLRDTYTYAVEFTLETVNAGGFTSNCVVNVNGTEATSIAYGKWRYEFVKNGTLSRIELYDIQMPTPGQTPDYTADKGNPPYSSYEVRWYTYANSDDGERMSPTDTFEEDTLYALEVLLTADDGYEFDHYQNDDAYAYINNIPAYTSYQGSNSVISAWIFCHTSACISEVDIYDVQYPIGGKTPDEDALVSGDVNTVEYATGSTVEWYYENAGNAGFSKLDGTFKSDRRHQAYVTVETYADYWFATDKDGNPAVSVTVDGEPMSFAYSTDSYTDDGMCNQLEVCRTFELAKDVDGVFVDGMWLHDGLYLDNDHWGVQTEDTVDKIAGYAYYEDGVLTLHDFVWKTTGDYDAIASFKPLAINAEGESYLESSQYGINIGAPLTLTGDGTASFYGGQRGLFAGSTLTVDSGSWYMNGEIYEGVWLYSDMTMNGGTFTAFGDDGGLYGDDWPTVTVNGGTLVASATTEYAISFCDMNIADGAAVTVSTETNGDNAAVWDGTTDFAEYAFVQIEVEETLLGDMDFNGILNMKDAMMLFSGVSGRKTFTEEQTAVADYNEDGSINMRDVMLLYAFISGK